MHLDKFTEKERKKYRRREIIPGLMIWATFIGSISLSFIKPLWVIYFIILFCLYWVLRLFYFVFYNIVSAYMFNKEIKVDWKSKRESLSNWQDYYHLFILPTYSEPYEVLETSLDGILACGYPSDKIIVAISWEERKKEVYDKVEPLIRQKYGDKFFKLLTTLHPDGLVGELKGKGANANWVGWKCKELIDQLGIPYEKIIVSYFDCDTQVHPKYLDYLTYRYSTRPNPTRSSFQPAVLYNNNIWEAPAPMRITAFSTVFWLLAELMRPDRLYTFSSHAISFKALVDVGFWEKDIVTDDSRIFLQCFIHYNGDYEVTPLYIPVSMDTVISEGSMWNGFKNLYKQQRRWGWGVEHFPYMLYHFRKKRDLIPFKTRVKYIWNLAEGMYSWATAPLLLFVLGRLPLYVSGPDVKSTVIAQNAPYVLEFLMTIGMIGILVSAILSIRLLPPRPKQEPKYKWLIMFLQWILLPINIVVFGAIPAAEAQTRLMLGKYLGFFVTPKARK
ncbi:MAG TPA: glycosyltransferase family 2 protein [Candidatus Uhrbacteria bacterium]|nr:glycosyltransferase family 2 protein [Candidatus Uhrbacteria bacterium]